MTQWGTERPPLQNPPLWMYLSWQLSKPTVTQQLTDFSFRLQENWLTFGTRNSDFNLFIHWLMRVHFSSLHGNDIDMLLLVRWGFWANGKDHRPKTGLCVTVGSLCFFNLIPCLPVAFLLRTASYNTDTIPCVVVCGPSTSVPPLALFPLLVTGSLLNHSFVFPK